MEIPGVGWSKTKVPLVGRASRCLLFSNGYPEVNVQNFKKVIIPGMLARDKIDEKGTTILRKNSATGFSKSCDSQKDLDKWKEHCKVKESVSNYSYFCQNRNG